LLHVLDRGTASWLNSSRDYLAILREKMLPLVEDTDQAADMLADSERKELAVWNSCPVWHQNELPRINDPDNEPTHALP
jgi:hypothetical protein